MELTKKDYQNALEVYNDWFKEYRIEISFPKYIKAKLSELEEQKPQLPQYRCIKLPPANNGMFKIGNLYLGFPLSDLPNHFELVEPEPEPEPEKITWHEVITLIESFKRKTHLPQAFYIELIKIIERIKNDHLS